MKRIIFTLFFSVLVVGAVFIIYLKSNPPLVVNGYTSTNDNQAILIEIENKGLRELQLQSIFVDDTLPTSTKLLISKSEPFEMDTKIDHNPNISFHKITQLGIFPSQYIDRKAIGKQPQYYALQVDATSLHKVTIQYNYFKIPFTLTVELQANK